MLMPGVNVLYALTNHALNKLLYMSGVEREILSVH